MCTIHKSAKISLIRPAASATARLIRPQPKTTEIRKNKKNKYTLKISTAQTVNAVCLFVYCLSICLAWVFFFLCFNQWKMKMKIKTPINVTQRRDWLSPGQFYNLVTQSATIYGPNWRTLCLLPLPTASRQPPLPWHRGKANINIQNQNQSLTLSIHISFMCFMQFILEPVPRSRYYYSKFIRTNHNRSLSNNKHLIHGTIKTKTKKTFWGTC